MKRSSRAPTGRERAGAEGRPAKHADAGGVFPGLRELAAPRAPYFVPLLAVLVSRVAACILTRVPAEDAFITFRYARSLATGRGLQFNPGEHVMGFTSPLWTLWCALGYALFHDPIVWARAGCIAADVVSLVVLVRLLDRHAGRASAWSFAVLFAAWPYFAFASASAMEMSLVLALIALAGALGAARSVFAGPVLAALALSRPEGFAAALLLAWFAPMRDRLVALGLAGSGLVALTIQFGSPIPQSLLSKATMYGTAGPWAGRYWWEWMSPFVLGRLPQIGDTAMLALLVLLLAPAFALGVFALWRERSTPLAHVAAAALGIWLGYILVGVAYFWWYLFVPLAGIALVGAVGFPRIVRGRALYITAALFVTSIWSVALNLYIGRAQQEQVAFGGAADQLRARCRPGDRVLLEPIGMVGYYAPVVVIDEVGLVTPRVAARRRQGMGWYTDIVARERPDWLVVRASVLRSGAAFAGVGAPFRSAAEREAVFAAYQEEARAGETNSESALVLMRRRP